MISVISGTLPSEPTDAGATARRLNGLPLRSLLVTEPPDASRLIAEYREGCSGARGSLRAG